MNAHLMRRVAFALLVAACTNTRPGTFHVSFVWPHGQPNDSNLFVSGRVEERDGDPAIPGTVLSSAAPLQYNGTGTTVSFQDVPYGRNRVVIVEFRDSSDPAASVVYYGLSAQFSLSAGDDKDVPVRIEPQSVPGSATGGIVPVTTGVQGYTKAVRLNLLLSTDTGTTVRLANTLDALTADKGATDVMLSTLATDMATGARVYPTWDLNDGLSPAALSSCDYQTEPTGCPRRVYAQFFDANGYPSPVVSAELVLDTVAPTLVPGADLQYVPASSDILPSVTAATIGTEVKLSFEVSEALTADPELQSVPDGLSFPQINPPPGTGRPMGTAFVFDGPLAAPAPPDGQYTMTVQATDLAGNQATLTLPKTIDVQTTQPAPPATINRNMVTYTRVPWGSQATGGLPSFTVTGAAGAVTAGELLVAYDGADPAQAEFIGSGRADMDGSFSLTLTRADRPAVYLTTVDAAGNQSAAVPVYDVVWVASFGKKLPGSTAANPNTLTEVHDFALHPAPTGNTDGGTEYFAPMVPDPSVSSEVGDYSRVAPDGGYLQITAAAVWEPRNLSSPPSPAGLTSVGCGLAYDAARDRSVWYCGPDNDNNVVVWEASDTAWKAVTDATSTVDSNLNGGPLVYDSAMGSVLGFPNRVPAGWDGTQWTTSTTNGNVPEGTSPIVYDSARNRVVAVDGSGDMAASTFTWEWDGSSWTIMNTGGPAQRDAESVVYDSRLGETFLYGGSLTDGTIMQDTWLWNGQQWTQWDSGSGPAPQARGDAAIGYDPVRDRVVLFGGGIDPSNTCQDGTTWAGIFSDTWEWDGSQWIDMTAGSAATPPPRGGGRMAYDSARGVMVLTGGSNVACQPLNDVWEWDGKSWRDVSPSPVTPSAVRGAVAVYDTAHAQTVLFGGADANNNLLNATLTWNGTAWHDVTPHDGNPSARIGHSMAYDSDHGRTVLFGGGTNLTFDPNGTPFIQGLLGDTWEWDGAAWTAIPTTGGPPARWGSAMAYDAAHKVTLLFGGCCDNVGSLYSDLWSWNGTTWTKLSPPGNAPSGRFMHAMAYDSDRQRLVLFGGTSETTSCFDDGDTWEWDGTRWTAAVNGVAPMARYGHQMTYDPVRGRTLLVGGTEGTYQGCEVIADKFWEWDGKLWTQLSVSTTAPPDVQLPAAALVYDTGRWRAVLVGGGSSSDVWESPSEPERRVAAVAEFAFSAAGDPAPVIQKIALDTSAAGCGNSVVIPGDGVAVPGATVAAWNTSAAAWQVLASNNTPGQYCATQLPALSPIHAEVDGTAAGQFMLGRSQGIHFAVFSSEGWGNGESPPADEVDVGPMELTVTYRVSAGL